MWVSRGSCCLWRAEKTKRGVEGNGNGVDERKVVVTGKRGLCRAASEFGGLLKRFYKRDSARWARLDAANLVEARISALRPMLTGPF